MNKALKSKIVLKFFTQEGFAAAIGERPSVVSNVIRGRRKLSDEKKIIWANALGSSIGEIFPINHGFEKQILGNTINDSDSTSNQKEETADEN